MDILAQAAAIVVDPGPGVPSHSGGQGPKVQGELLGAPRPLPQVEQTFTRRYTLRRVVKNCAKVAGELCVMVQHPQ